MFEFAETRGASLCAVVTRQAIKAYSFRAELVIIASQSRTINRGAMMTIKLGIIGAGRIGRLHANTLTTRVAWR